MVIYVFLKNYISKGLSHIDLVVDTTRKTAKDAFQIMGPLVTEWYAW